MINLLHRWYGLANRMPAPLDAESEKLKEPKNEKVNSNCNNHDTGESCFG